MQTITKTYNVYTFDELDDKAKEKAREWYRQGNDYYFLSDAITEHATDLLEQAGFTSLDNLKVYYSFSYSQGDGAMAQFTANYEHGDNAYTVKVTQYGHYNHYNSADYDISDFETGEDANSDVYEHIKKLCVGIFKDLEKYGYDYIEYEDSSESVDENIMANEYTFLIDGTRED